MLHTRQTPWRSLGLLGLAVGATVAASRAGRDSRRKRPLRPAPRGTLAGVRERMVIDRSAEEIYAVLRRAADWQRWLPHLESVVESSGMLRWRARLPGGGSVDWQAALTENAPRSIAWDSPDGAPFAARGSIRLDELPHGRGTLVAWTMIYERTPTGIALARLTRRELKSALRRFKQFSEANEIATVRGQPSGRCSVHSDRPHPSRSDERLDLALEESFPVSDPTAVP